MKNILIFAFIITFTSNLFGQTINEKEIEGTWKVEKVISKNSNPELKDLFNGFKNATFVFFQNKKFELSTTSSSKLFSMITSMTKGSKWKFNSKDKTIKIGSLKDKFSIMSILILESNDQILFQLKESGIVLQMKKME